MMGKTHFGAINNQPHLLKMSGLHFQPAASYWLVPIPDIDRRVFQKAAKVLYHAEQLRFARNFSPNPAQADRTALMYANDQPSKVLNASFSFNRLQLSNSGIPSMIEFIDRHGALLKLFWQNQGYTFRADQSFIRKV
ncbi:MAG: hypothetical protein IT316_07965 [Anaerolineales bacterium]|nr:hypothetical protein [Anaerolineales bacterium]